jgi:hypothetical protein
VSGTSANDRNTRAKEIVDGLIRRARSAPLSANAKMALTGEFRILERLIPIQAKGFRGIVLTGIVGKLLDDTYNPLENFYGCSPRSIFEQGIYYSLTDARIPCGQSDPLNVAKNARKIDMEWANGRRPEDAAKAAVEYLQIIENDWHNEQRRFLVIQAFFERLVKYAEEVDGLVVPMLYTYDIPLTVTAFEAGLRRL